ncbi:hypothetical protein BGHDH14_bgh03307 [Blumeria hordei DH14]|uniref:Uncharacterized protein n=1 Tax=Blumeria graminis f. sp. hordei (strain DH14) TaxID=546991 RepID=N1J5E9_BLUG1|nr:hypothetical protein BGHDH14_bgh03307 [Blumeria hordei DH14]
MIFPAETPAPSANPTANPNLEQKTVDASICGWVGGRADAPALCSAGSTCVRDVEHQYVGCCGTSGSCSAGIYTSCLDRNSMGWSAPGGIQSNGVYTCSANSECYRNTYAGGYYQYGCGESGWAAQVETTYSGQPTNLVLDLIYTTITFAGATSESTLTASTTTSSSTSLPLSTSHLPTIPVYTASASAIASASSDTKRPPPGAIAGIIIAAVNGAAIIVALGLWLCRRRRKRGRKVASVRPRSNPDISRGLRILETISIMSPLKTVLPKSYRAARSTLPAQRASLPQPPPYISPNQQESRQLQSLFIENSETDENTHETQTNTGARNEDRSLNPEPEIGLAISSDRQSLLRLPVMLNTDESPSAIDWLPESSSSSECDFYENSTAPASPVSEEYEASFANSAGTITHPGRGNKARYHLVDEVIHGETSVVRD